MHHEHLTSSHWTIVFPHCTSHTLPLYPYSVTRGSFTVGITTTCQEKHNIIPLIKRSNFHWAIDASVAQWNFDRLIKTRTRVRSPAGVRKWQNFSILVDSWCDQFDHMDCEFFQESLWIAASGRNRLLSYLKSSREFLDSLPADYDIIQPKNPEYLDLIKRSSFHWAKDASMAHWKLDRLIKWKS